VPKTPHIFLADDKGELALLRQGFADCGVTVDIHLVKDGEAALQQLMQGSSAFDLVVLDYYLPKKTGGEVVQGLIGEAFPSCPLVILTTALRPELRTKAINSGVRAILDKPSDLDGYNKLATNLLRLMELKS